MKDCTRQTLTYVQDNASIGGLPPRFHLRGTTPPREENFELGWLHFFISSITQVLASKPSSILESKARI